MARQHNRDEPGDRERQSDPALPTEPSAGSDEGGSAAQDLLLQVASARLALERGDYGRVRRLLEPLTEQHPAATRTGGELRLLLATALIGQGQTAEAAAQCRALRGCQDADLRARAREIQEVLDAPALSRPREWSLTLPDLSGAGSLESQAAEAPRLRRRRRSDPPPPPPPPVGPTRAPSGFAAVVALLLSLLLLASLLGGCVQVTTDLHFAGPGRLQIRHRILEAAAGEGPWRGRFTRSLTQAGFRRVEAADGVRLETAVLPMAQARTALEVSLRAAAEATGEPLPDPGLAVQERNWLLGVSQRLELTIDLRPLPPVGGVDLTVHLEGLGTGARAVADPRPVRSLPDHSWSWPLQPGSLNSLQLQRWCWSPLGVGAVAVALLLPLVLALQRLRRQLGFGLPELPA